MIFQSNHFLNRFLAWITRILLQLDSTPKWVFVACLCAEFLSIFYVLNSKVLNLSTQSIPILSPSIASNNLAPLLVLMVIIFLQIRLRVSLIKAYYILVFQVYLNFNVSGLIFCVSSVFSLVLEVSSNINNSFYSTSAQPEQNNHIKYLHYLVIALCLLTNNLLGNSKYQQIIVFCLFTMLLCLRIYYRMHNRRIKILYQYLYLTLAVAAMLNLCGLQSLLPEEYLAGLLLVVVILSQIKAYVCRNDLITRQKLKSDSKISIIVRNMLIYIVTCEFNKEEHQNIQQFVKINKDELNMDPCPLRIENQQQYLKKISQLLLKVQNQQTFEFLLLKAEVLFRIHRNYFKTLKIVREIEQKIGKFSLIQRLLIYRIKTQIFQQISFQFTNHPSSQYESFLSNARFITKMYEAVNHYKDLWMVITETEIIISKIEVVATKILVANKQLKEIYQSLENKSKHTIWLYTYYLFLVQRNLDLTVDIYNQHEFAYQKLTKFNYKNSILLKMSLQQSEIGQILQVSHNVAGLLGYQASDLLHKTINPIIPQIFHSLHEYVLTRIIRQSPATLLDFKRTTICQDSEGNLHEVNINFRILYSLEEDVLCTIGFMELLKSENKLFILIEKTTGLIIQMPSRFKNKGLHLSQFMDVEYNQGLIGRLRNKQQIYLHFQQQNDKISIGFQFYCQTLVENQTVLILKNIALQDHIEIPSKVQHIKLFKFTIPANSSLTTFFETRKKFYEDTQSRSKLFFKVFIIIVLFIAMIGLCSFNIIVESVRAQQKYNLINLFKLLQTKQTNTLESFIWAHYINVNATIGINYSSVDYGQIINQLTETEFNNYQLRSFQQDTVIQIQGKNNYRITLQQLTGATISVLMYVYQNIFTTNLTTQQIRSSMLNYVIQNEQSITIDGLQILRNNLSTYSDEIVKIYANLYLLCCVFEILVVFVTCLVLVLFDWQKSSNHLVLSQIISNVKNQDRFVFTEAIRTYLHKLTGKSALQFYSNLNDQDMKITKRLFAQKQQHLQSLSPNSQSTHRLFFKSSLSGTNIFQENKPVKQIMNRKVFDEVFERLDSQKVKLQQKKQIRIPYLLLFLLSLVTISTIVLNVLYYVNSISKSYPSSGYTKGMINFQIKSSLYLQKIEYFYKAAEDNFTDLSLLQQIFTDEMNFLKTYTPLDVSLLAFDEFAAFNQIYNSINFQSICSYADCGQFDTLLNGTIETIYLNNGQYLLNTAIANYNTTNLSYILNDSQLNFIAYTKKLFSKIMLDALQIYYSCVNEHISISKNLQMKYYILNLSFYLLFVVTVLIPNVYNLVKRHYRAREILDIVDENIYKKT